MQHIHQCLLFRKRLLYPHKQDFQGKQKKHWKKYMWWNKYVCVKLNQNSCRISHCRHGQTHFTLLLGISVSWWDKTQDFPTIYKAKFSFWIDKGGAALMYTVLLGIGKAGHEPGSARTWNSRLVCKAHEPIFKAKKHWCCLSRCKNLPFFAWRTKWCVLAIFFCFDWWAGSARTLVSKAWLGSKRKIAAGSYPALC